jgi:hypothetical protein
MFARILGNWRAGSALAIVAVLTLGCATLPGSGPAVVGQGPVVTEDRQVEPFTMVEIKNGIKLVLSFGPTTSVQVSAQQNVLPLVSTMVTSGKLTAQTTQSVVGPGPVTVTVVTPTLTALTTSAGAFVEATGVSGDTFALVSDTGSNIKITGTTGSLSITARDGTLLQLESFAARDANLTLQNGVTGTINASGTVTGNASNGVLLSVTGGATVDVSTSAGAIVTSR